MHRQDHGKALWRFLPKERDPGPNVYVFADGGNGDRRALSLAYAVADGCGCPGNSGRIARSTPRPDTTGRRRPTPTFTRRPGRAV